MDPIETSVVTLDQLRRRIADLEEKLLDQRVREAASAPRIKPLEHGEKLMK